jgi:hypothetical protein
MNKMLFSETKKAVFALVILISAVFLLPKNSDATDYSSAAYTVKDPVIDSGQLSSSSLNFGLGQSISQLAIGKSASASFQLWSGFQYFYQVDANTLNAVPGGSQVNLTWTVPATNLGISVAGYELGTGTVSGSYTFEDVGNVTNFSKLGLTNGTPYFFVVRAYATGGTILVYSNEATATPTGGGGGGVGGPPPSPYGNVTISGTAYPNAQVTLLQDSVVHSTVPAGADGAFSFNLGSLSSGNYSFGVYAVDLNGIKSATAGFVSTVSTGQTTAVNNLVVPPTLQQSHVSVKQGEPVTFSGYSAPSSLVTLYFNGPAGFSQPLISNPNGTYSHSLATATMPKGNYTVSAVSTVNGVSSVASISLNFSVSDTDVVTPPPGDCQRSDLNCDGRVGLVDFSILLYFWEQTDFSRNPRADISKDGKVELRDLSIMLYDWTG